MQARNQLAELERKTKDELLSLAKDMKLENGTALEMMRKQDLLVRLLAFYAEQQGVLLATGVLDVVNDGHGFLRLQALRTSAGDVYVSQSQIRRFRLRNGDQVTGQVRPPKDGERYYGLVRVEALNGQDPESITSRTSFESLTPVFPDKVLRLETTKKALSARLIDLVTPIGKGQRGMIVSPPKAGKTMLLKAIANGVSLNYPDVHLIVALIGERPEEVTDVQRSVDGQVFYSTFDEPVEDHCHVAELCLDRAKRLVEIGIDVVILLDSITRLTRAYNLAMPTSGRTLSGGIDPVALYPPKRFFGAARNTEEGASLTVIATCLVDTGSRMDDVIYEEFKGTGNMELHLERRLSERRIFPAIDIQRSGTRREELLFDENTLRQVWIMRRMASMINSDSNHSSEATERVLEHLGKTDNNAEFLNYLSRQTQSAS